MAHQLLDDTMFYVGDTPWHKLGIKLEKPPSIQSALVQSNLDWKVQKVPTVYQYTTILENINYMKLVIL